MKETNLTFLFILISNLMFSQNFEGYILYDYVFLDSSGNDITSEMSNERGSEQHYYINSNNYKAIDDKGRLVQLYNSESNIYYFQNGEIIQQISAKTEYPKLFDAKPSNETEVIANYNCKSVVVKGDSGITQYFYNENVSVDKDNFDKHRFGSWSQYLNYSNGALPLKFIVKNESYTWIATAVKVEEVELDDDEFEVGNYFK